MVRPRTAFGKAKFVIKARIRLNLLTTIVNHVYINDPSRKTGVSDMFNAIH